MRVDDGVDNDVYWTLRDHLSGTSITLTDTGGVYGELFYTAFGETQYSSGTTPTDIRYTGQREEADIGLYFYNARWYDPELGRFAQADTILPNPADAKSFDRFAYVANNPLRYIDPSGHTECESETNFCAPPPSPPPSDDGGGCAFCPPPPGGENEDAGNNAGGGNGNGNDDPCFIISPMGNCLSLGEYLDEVTELEKAFEAAEEDPGFQALCAMVEIRCPSEFGSFAEFFSEMSASGYYWSGTVCIIICADYTEIDIVSGAPGTSIDGWSTGLGANLDYSHGMVYGYDIFSPDQVSKENLNYSFSVNAELLGGLSIAVYAFNSPDSGETYPTLWLVGVSSGVGFAVVVGK